MSKITTEKIRELLHEKYSNTSQYIIAEEVGNATGERQKRRLDMVVVDCYKSGGIGYSLTGIEIKTLKSDLRKELQDTSKHNIFYPSLDYFYLVAPSDIVQVNLLPPKWGIIMVDQYGDDDIRLRTYRHPLALHDEVHDTVDKDFCIGLSRAIQKTSARGEELKEAEDKGYLKCLVEKNFHSMKQRIEELEFELEAYKELKETFELGSGYQAKEMLDNFKTFKNLDLGQTLYSLKSIRRIANRELEKFDNALDALESDIDETN